MSNVLRIVRPSNDDTVTVLKGGLTQALAHNIKGLALCYCDGDGVEHVVVTDAYAAHPDKAIRAALRILAQVQAQDEGTGPPGRAVPR